MSGALRPLGLDGLTELLERAALRGRGGAAFPTATKLRAVAAAKGAPVIVVNAAEGEPLSHKDRYLLGASPDTVLDGAIAAASATRADEIIVAVDQALRPEASAIEHAATRRPELVRRRLRFSVQTVPTGYVTGQETALVSALSGRAAKPTFTPPYPFEAGVRGRPTLVSNTETYSHIGRIVRGTYDGTRLVTVSGAVRNPGLVEILPATTLEDLCDAAGGPSERVHGVLLGGYGGTWGVLHDHLATRLDEPALRAAGLTLGAGIVHLLPASACPVAEIASVVDWMAGESAGQCGPCIHGLDALADALDELTRRGDPRGSYRDIGRWTKLIQRRGACAHPDGVARFVASATGVFAEAFERHVRQGACRGCAARRILPTPQRSPEPAHLVAAR